MPHAWGVDQKNQAWGVEGKRKPKAWGVGDSRPTAEDRAADLEAEAEDANLPQLPHAESAGSILGNVAAGAAPMSPAPASIQEAGEVDPGSALLDFTHWYSPFVEPLAAPLKAAWRVFWNAPQLLTNPIEAGRQVIAGESTVGEAAKALPGQLAANVLGGHSLVEGKFFGRDISIISLPPRRPISPANELVRMGFPKSPLTSLLGFAVEVKTMPNIGFGLPKGAQVVGVARETVAAGGGFMGAGGLTRRIISRVTASREGVRVYEQLHADALTEHFGPAAAAIWKGMKSAGQDYFRDLSATRLFEMAQRAPELLAKREFVYGPLHLRGSTIAKAGDVIDVARARIANRLLGWSITGKAAGMGARAMLRARDYYQRTVEPIFSVIPARARKGFSEAEPAASKYNAALRNGRTEIETEYVRTTKGLGVEDKNAIRDWLDEPDQFPLPPGLEEAGNMLRNNGLEQRRIEMALGHSFPERVDYVKHIYYVDKGAGARAATSDDFARLSQMVPREWQTRVVSPGMMGGAVHPRVYGTYRDGIAGLNTKAAERGLKWTFSAAPLEDSILERGIDHMNAVAWSKVESSLMHAYGYDKGVVMEQRFKTFLPEIHDLAKKVVQEAEGTPGSVIGQAVAANKIRIQQELAKYAAYADELGHGVADAGKRAAEYASLDDIGLRYAAKEKDELTKVLYKLQRMREVTNHEEYVKLLEDLPKLGEVDPGLYNLLRSYLAIDLRLPKSTSGFGYGEYKASNGHVYWLPEPVIASLKNLAPSVQISDELHQILNTVDATTTLYKGGMTSHIPSFHSRNAYNNVATMVSDIGIRAADPRKWARSWGVMHGAEGTLVGSPSGPLTYSQARDLLKEYGLFNERDFTLETALDKKGLVRRILNNPLSRKGREIGTFTENWAKATSWVAKVESGMTPEVAAWEVQQSLFDYDWLTKTQKDYARRVFPWFTWTWKNKILQARFLTRNPKRIVALEKLGDALSTDHEQRGPDEAALSDYQRGRFKIRLLRDGNVTYVHGIDLPHRAFLDNVFIGDAGEVFMRTLNAESSNLTPWLKGFEAYNTGKDPTTGIDIRAAVNVPPGIALAFKHLPEPTKKWLHFVETEDAEGNPAYKMSGTKSYLFLSVLAAERVLWLQPLERTLKNKAGLSGFLLDFFTGIHTQMFDQDTIDSRIANRRIRDAAQRLKDAGLYRGYEIAVPQQ